MWGKCNASASGLKREQWFLVPLTYQNETAIPFIQSETLAALYISKYIHQSTGSSIALWLLDYVRLSSCTSSKLAWIVNISVVCRTSSQLMSCVCSQWLNARRMITKRGSQALILGLAMACWNPVSFSTSPVGTSQGSQELVLSSS